ncbi:hypothetical protein HK100_011534 [Physocladia obscura]|uniref:Nucleotide-diphospho-sugar transferase domain-containing protein n=1 Tax=Physocladia obscura TaxID=109957 RepID=A0AAD5T2S9_9FUNG|nr:hypothetical protein HK100_011534 [Physocladia obscura]
MIRQYFLLGTRLSNIHTRILLIGVFWLTQTFILLALKHKSESSIIRGKAQSKVLPVLANLPAGFKFTPPYTKHDLPGRKRPVITLLTGPPLQHISFNTPENELSESCLLALLHSHIFHNYDFIVLTTTPPSISYACTNSLLANGARIFHAPPVSAPPADTATGHRYAYTFTKLHMWALDGLFESILYLDTDMFLFSNETLEVVWDAYDEVGQPEFAACEDWQIRGTVNTGLMIFKPSAVVYKELMKSVTTTGGFGDQGTINAYFSSNKNRTATINDQKRIGILPRRFNTQWVMHRSDKELLDAVGVHHKFFKDSVGENIQARRIFQRFSEQFLELRRVQYKRFVEAVRSGRIEDTFSVPIVPVVPDSLPKLKEVMRLRTRFDRIAIVTDVRNSFDVNLHVNRDSFAKKWSQAVHIIYDGGSRRGSAPPMTMLGQILNHIAENMLDTYEWVWVLGDGVILNLEADQPIHAAFNVWTEPDSQLVLFQDCQSIVGQKSSFAVGKNAKTKIQEFLTAKTIVEEGEVAAENAAWQKFEIFMKSKTKVIGNSGTGYYYLDDCE